MRNRHLAEDAVTVLGERPSTLSKDFTQFFIPPVHIQSTGAAELTLSFTENLCRSTPSVRAWLSRSPDWLRGAKEVCHWGSYSQTEVEF